MAKVKTALISVYDKTGVIEFAQELEKRGVIIYASGGTAKKLSDAGISVIDVATLVGGGAILGHRVVTLSREVHAGLLAQYGTDVAELETLGIPYIDLVYNNLYPLKEEIAKPNATLASVIEQTDIGGPTALRSAAKGGRLVVYDPADLDLVLRYIDADEPDEGTINYLAAKAEFYVAGYVLASAEYRSFGKYKGLLFTHKAICKYGENGYQTAGLYSDGSENPLAIHRFKELNGKAIGSNGYCDIDRLLHTLRKVATGISRNSLTINEIPLIAIAVKHGNPCGAGIGTSRINIIEKTMVGDSRAIFGGFVMTSFEIDIAEARTLLHYCVEDGKKRMLHGIAAPSFTDEAVAYLTENSDALLVVNEAIGTNAICSLSTEKRFRQVEGGMILQDPYNYVLDFGKITSTDELTAYRKKNLVLAWGIGSTSNSNTVTVSDNGMLIGNGVGQQDRVSCCELAVKKATDAGHAIQLNGAVAYSDSFFPFTDGPEVLIEAGVDTIFASSGSVKDKAVIECCNDAGVTLCLVPDKEGRGFFGH